MKERHEISGDCDKWAAHWQVPGRVEASEDLNGKEIQAAGSEASGAMRRRS
jgi:hypothetical protein